MPKVAAPRPNPFAQSVPTAPSSSGQPVSLPSMGSNENLLASPRKRSQARPPPQQSAYGPAKSGANSTEQLAAQLTAAPPPAQLGVNLNVDLPDYSPAMVSPLTSPVGQASPNLAAVAVVSDASPVSQVSPQNIRDARVKMLDRALLAEPAHTRSDSPARMSDGGAPKWSGGIKKGGSANDGARELRESKAAAVEADAKVR